MNGEPNTIENQFETFFEVTRYVCRLCGREFKTTSRHHCKFDPAFRNCFSCKKCTGIHWTTDNGTILTEQEAKEREYIGCSKVFSCSSHVDERFLSIAELSAQKWNAGCSMWEIAPSYVGKDSFLRKMWDLQNKSTL